MKKEVIHQLHKNFEDCARRKDDVEYWLARELQTLLGYKEWRNFELVIDKAKVASQNAGQAVSDHFVDVNKMIEVGKTAEREVSDIALTRYACYLIAQNGDPRKDAVAFAMTYFAVQTRKQELIEVRMAEWERLRAREKLTLSQKELSGVLFERGIDSPGFSRILSRGDAALFGGLSTHDMKQRLAVPDSRPLADFLPTITIKQRACSGSPMGRAAAFSGWDARRGAPSIARLSTVRRNAADRPKRPLPEGLERNRAIGRPNCLHGHEPMRRIRATHSSRLHSNATHARP